MKRLSLFITLLTLLAAAKVAWAQNGPYELSWWTIDGGGGYSSDGPYAVVGTIAQPDAGHMAGGKYGLDGGYWIEGFIPPLASRYLPVIQRQSSSQPWITEVTPQDSPYNDPILQQGRLDPSVMALAPDTPEQYLTKGAHDLAEETKWHVLAEAALTPGSSQQISLFFPEPVLIEAQVRWSGSPTPVSLALTKEGVNLAAATTYAVPPDYGMVRIRVEIEEAGSADLTVTNPGGQPVQVFVVAGLLPLSYRDGGAP